jgi:hypothetical protein
MFMFMFSQNSLHKKLSKLIYNIFNIGSILVQIDLISKYAHGEKIHFNFFLIHNATIEYS